MRRMLLATFAVVGLAGPARGQFAVVDLQQIIQQEFHQVQTLVEWAGQAANMAQQISGDIERLRQLEAAYYAITRVTDLGTAVYALGLFGIRNPLPINPYALQGLINGTGGPQGMLGNLSGLYTGTLTMNRIYEAPGDTWMERNLNMNGGAIAGIQATALQLYQSAAERIPLLEELQARINGAPDPSEREALIARFAAEQNYVQNAQVQAQSIGTYAAAQFQLVQQQREEVLMESMNRMHAGAQARGAIR